MESCARLRAVDRSHLVLVLALVAAAACSDAPAATTQFFGTRIEPPRGLAVLRPGMTVSEARTLVPGLREDHRGVREHLVLDSGVADVRLEIRIDSGTVASILAVVHRQNARELLTTAWGDPRVSKDALGQPEVWWASESTGWKVELDCLERNCVIEYVPYVPLSPDYFGAHVVPPGPLAALSIGMPVADARRAAPGIVDVRAGLPAGVDGVRQYVGVDDKRRAIAALYLNLPSHAKTLIEAAWGPGLVATEPVGRRVLVWPDPTTGWRATLREALGSSFDLAFENYLPAAQLFGEQPDVLDAIPVLGMAIADVARRFPTELLQVDGAHLLSLRPTEWERTATSVELELAAGRVRRLTFAIPFKAYPPAHDQLLQLFTAKWGIPRPSHADGQRVLIFREGDPRVEVFEDAEHEAWRLEIRK